MSGLFFACLGTAEIGDLDADGFSGDVTCDDLDAEVNPDAPVICNSVDEDGDDENCDGDTACI